MSLHYCLFPECERFKNLQTIVYFDEYARSRVEKICEIHLERKFGIPSAKKQMQNSLTVLNQLILISRLIKNTQKGTNPLNPDKNDLIAYLRSQA